MEVRQYQDSLGQLNQRKLEIVDSGLKDVELFRQLFKDQVEILVSNLGAELEKSDCNSQLALMQYNIENLKKTGDKLGRLQDKLKM